MNQERLRSQSAFVGELSTAASSRRKPFSCHPTGVVSKPSARSVPTEPAAPCPTRGTGRISDGSLPVREYRDPSISLRTTVRLKAEFLRQRLRKCEVLEDARASRRGIGAREPDGLPAAPRRAGVRRARGEGKRGRGSVRHLPDRLRFL